MFCISKKIYSYSLSFIILSFFPYVVKAADIGGDSGDGPSLKNPLGDDSTLTKLLNDILDVIMVFAVPVIVFFIIYAGFLYVTAQGDESKVTKGHKALLYAVVGGVIILGAKVLLEVIKGTIEAF